MNPSFLFGPHGTQLQTLGRQRGFTVQKPTDVLDNPAIATAMGDVVDLYLNAGATDVTIPCFGDRALIRNGRVDAYQEVTARKLAIVLERLQRRSDLNRNKLRLLFSLGPKNDCYEPKEAPDTKEAREFHSHQIQHIEALSLRHGIPLIAQFETQPSGVEAEGIALALRDLHREKISAIISYPFTIDGHPLGNESFTEIIQRVDQHQNGLRIQHGLNCGPIEGIPKALQRLGRLAERISVVYPNASSRPQKELDSATDVQGLIDRRKTAAFLRYLAAEYPLQVLGGCCGYDHEDINALVNGRETSPELPPTDVKSRLETGVKVA